MNKTTANKIAETITNEQIAEMFKNAASGIADWAKVSSVNRGMTKGAAWNILAKDFDVNEKYHHIGKRNMVWEFGDFLPNELVPQKKDNKHKSGLPVHQEPKF